MKKIYKIMISLLVASSLFGCGEKTSDSSSSIENPEIEVCSFEDFQFLMFVEGGSNVIKDRDGNIYTVSDDGYYYTSDGEKIKDYGAGDIETVKNHKSFGAIIKTDMVSGGGDNSPNGSSKSDNKNDAKDESDVSNDENSEAKIPEEFFDAENSDIISDWDSAKEKIKENAGIVEATTEAWYTVDDDMGQFEAGKGDAVISQGDTYDTVINMGFNIPATLSFQTISKVTEGDSINYEVLGSITVDGVAFNEHMKELYGDTQMTIVESIDENGETISEETTVPADYAQEIKNRTVSAYLGYGGKYGLETGNIVMVNFDDNYSGSFTVSIKAPTKETEVFIYIQDVPYKF